MTTLQDLRRKIESASDLGSVVTTMKTLAAVSIRQYEMAVEALSQYSHTIDLGFQIVLHNAPGLAESNPGDGRTGVVVFGTDQGMCGQFNEEVVSLVQATQSNLRPAHPWRLFVVARAEAQLAEAGLTVDRTFEVPTSVSDITNLVFELLPRIDRWRSESEVVELLVFYNRRTSASAFEPQKLSLLPIDSERFRQWRELPWQSRALPMFVTERRQLLSRLIRQYVFVSLFRACAESLASENASRIAAMQSAEKNIEERLDELHGDFNHLRQTAITEELLDVVTGFEALSQQRHAPRPRR